MCGDGRVSAGEECDDGNRANGDGWSPDCTREVVADWTCPRHGTVATGATASAAYDPDCDDPDLAVRCPEGAECDRNGECVEDEEVGSGWTCPESYFDAEDGCDCACGVRPGLRRPDATVYGCGDGEVCAGCLCAGRVGGRRRGGARGVDLPRELLRRGRRVRL